MAFESLSDKLQKIMKKVKGQAKLTESNMDEMLREIRIALLEADVNYKVVKEFVGNVKEKALGQKVLTKLSPGQMIVKIVRDEITELLGSGETEIRFEMNKPTVIMLVGLQGTGKTTSAGKLARLFQKKYGKKVLMAACDIYRPAAIDQLETLGKKLNTEVYTDRSGTLPPDIAKAAYRKALDEKYDVLLIDTAGRLQIDDALMTELENIGKEVPITETILLVDAMSGQDAVNVAKSFNETLGIDGVILTKLDGDTRGGAALSVRAVTGKPIKFIGTGEKLDNLETFHTSRMASRILGMGDVLSFIEKAEQSLDEKKAAELEKKLAKNKFDLNDLLDQFEQIERMGSLKDTIKMIPGIGNKIKDEDIDEKAFDRFRAIIYSMTKQERERPDIINPSRKRRIAKGCGMQVEDVNKLLAQFKQMQKMVKQIGGNKGPRMSKKMRRMMQANPEMAEKMMGKMGGGSNNPFGF